MKTTLKRGVNGILLLDKPKNFSSNQILQKVKRLFNAKKAGHTGALDPIATGMLPICFGEATKFSQFLLDSDKSYQVIAKLGEKTNTSDAEGDIVSIKPINVDLKVINQVITNFVGNIMQIPTMFSALKHQGTPLYEYARKGIDIARPARPITIYSIDLIEYNKPFLKLNVKCSKGTYIRTLIDDLGDMLGCGAHVTELRRLQVANYDNKKMHSLEYLSNLNILELDSLLLPIDTAISSLPAVYIDQTQTNSIFFGKQISLDNITKKINNDFNPTQVKIINHNNEFIGIGELTCQTLAPKRLINTNH